MDTHVCWTALQQPGLEHLHLMEHEAEIVADGLVLAVEGAAPYRLWYQVRADGEWRVRECLLQVGGVNGATMRLSSDGLGHWTDADGNACASLDGCLDVDISVTPFTNTLPLRRLALAPDASADLQVVYISVPALSVRLARQRYTCLARTASGGRYRYEGLESGFQAELAVDAQALVVDYPNLWKRVGMSAHGSGNPAQPGAGLAGLLASGPHPDLADQLHLFGQFVGDWDVDWTGYQADGSVGQTAKGEIHFAWVLDGRAIQDVWIFPTREDLRRGQSIDEWGSTMRLYDPNAQTWSISWHGPVQHVVRALTARPVDGDIWVEGLDGTGRPLRWVFSRITTHSFHWSNFIAEDSGQTWRLQEDLAARRVA
jgi:uncharacterized protein